MKFYKFPVFILVFALFFSVNYIFAQEEETSEQEEMDEEQWEAQILELTAKKNDLTTKAADLQKEIDGYTLQSNLKSEELKKTEEAYWNEFGGKDAYNTFKKDLDNLEIQCRKKEGMQVDAMAKFDALTKSEWRCHPEFFSRYKKLKECLDGWQSSVPEYTIQKGEYLFVIAMKKEVYNNKHMWPVIWEANENGVLSAPRGIPKTIRNPHLVYPGQVLKIPKLTESLKKSEIFERAKGWLDWKKNRMRKKNK